jgi:hypothetical protein
VLCCVFPVFVDLFQVVFYPIIEKRFTAGEIFIVSLKSPGHLESIEANLFSNQDADCFHDTVNSSVVGAKDNSRLFPASNTNDLEGVGVFCGLGIDCFGVKINVEEVFILGNISPNGIHLCIREKLNLITYIFIGLALGHD